MDESLLVSMTGAMKITSLSRTTINIKRARGEFPQAVSLGERRLGFVRAEVVAWVEARIAERGAKAAKKSEAA